MALIRISESNDWFVDYDRERGMYRVSYFEDNHFKDECWFDCYEEKVSNKTELIGRLEMLKESAARKYGEYVYMSIDGFKRIIDAIIEYIE